MNPIYIEYYTHEDCDCYKINLPWTDHKLHKVVLCPISKGIEHAKLAARGVIREHLDKMLEEEIKDK